MEWLHTTYNELCNNLQQPSKPALNHLPKQELNMGCSFVGRVITSEPCTFHGQLCTDAKSAVNLATCGKTVWPPSRVCSWGLYEKRPGPLKLAQSCSGCACSGLMLCRQRVALKACTRSPTFETGTAWGKGCSI